MRQGPNGAGLSRKAIMTEIDASLRRLGTDYVDLYQIHRWDPRTPIEETMEALHDVVKAGKARYIGASSMYAWQFAKAQHVAERNGWTRFVTMQDHYNLLYREEEREMLPLCADQGVGVIPWSPLARGRLTRDWDDAHRAQRRPTSSARRCTRDGRPGDRRARSPRSPTTRGVPRAQVALAWVLRKPAVTAPIVGATKPHHLDDAVAAVELRAHRRRDGRRWRSRTRRSRSAVTRRSTRAALRVLPGSAGSVAAMRRLVVALAITLAACGSAAAGGDDLAPSAIGAGLAGRPVSSATTVAAGLSNVAALAFDDAGRLWAATASMSDDGTDAVSPRPIDGAAPGR